MRNCFTLILLFIAVISYAQQPQKKHVTAAEIDAVFSQWNTTTQAGIAVGIVSDGRTIYTKGYGLASMEHKVPISPETKFLIGDIAKEFTVYSILLLEERGKLSMDNDVRRYLPQLKDYPTSLTIEELVYHTSGLNNHAVSKALSGWAHQDVLSKEQAYKMVENQANSNPDKNGMQAPTDFGFMILEDVISQVSGQTYAEFVESEIFKPLGMYNSVYDVSGQVIENKAQGYFRVQEAFSISHFAPDHTLVSDLYTTVEDMCLWAQELFNPKVGSRGMVSKFDNLSEVNGEHVEMNNLALYTGGHRYWNFMGAHKLYHIEVSGGYASKLIRYPDYNLAVVVLGNDGAYNGYAGTGASELYIREFLTPPVASASSEVKTVELSSDQLLAYQGHFWDGTNHTSRKIQMDRDTLWYVRGPENRSALVPTSDHSFRMITQGDVEVVFNQKVNPMTMQVRVGEEVFDMESYDEEALWSRNLDSFTGDYYSDALDVTYSIAIDRKLKITHPRMESITLEPRIRDLFSGNQEFFESIKFKRDENGQVIGFTLSTMGFSEVWFQKKSISSI